MPVRTSGIAERDAALGSWWTSPLGRALLAAESELLAAALEDIFGWELLQIGAWGTGRELLRGSRTRRQSLLTLPSFPAGADIIARPSHLPVMSDCIDAALLPHTLEFAADPYAILREADRVLVGEGQLLLLGLPAAEPVGHARALEPHRLSARDAARALGAPAYASGWCCSATRWSPSSAISTSGPGAADWLRGRARGGCCVRA